MRQFSTSELSAIPQELKEAVCNAIVEMTVRQVSGGGNEGKYLYGSSPRRSIVSGQLLPRFDQNQEDETSDVRIAAIGVDFQLGATVPGNISIRPFFSVYVRVLPSWNEITDDALDLEPDFRLRKQIQDLIDARIRQLRSERFAAANIAKPNWPALNPTERQQLRAKRNAIEDEVRLQAYGEQGIILENGDEALISPSPNMVTPQDVNASLVDNQPATETSISPEDISSRLRLGRLLQRGRQIPSQHLESAPPPAKWRRIDLSFEALSLPLQSSAEEVKQALQEYNVQLCQSAKEQVRAWLQSEEGVRTAFRNLLIRPEDIASEQGWLSYLTRAAAMPVIEADLMPSFDGVAVQLDRTIDFLDSDRVSVRVLLDNANIELSQRALSTRLDTIFSTKLVIELPSLAHKALHLDRVEPSYRFRHFLDYPAIGLNCGVVARPTNEKLTLETTWSPHFVQPRIIARSLTDLPISFQNLSDETKDIAALFTISDEYIAWIDAEHERLRDHVREGLSIEDADRESRRLEQDIRAQRKEADYIKKGVTLLKEAQDAYRKSKEESNLDRRADLLKRAVPYRAWLSVNRSYLKRERGNSQSKWRLFQLAFILAHIPTLASRMTEYRDYQDQRMDEFTASLLYFPTGGGKSEAFYGTLLFAMFLDRMRGKSRGVTVMIRYPLRLLTLQQGQRLLRLITFAELQRLEEGIEGWPFEIGFWVGGNNTPNRYNQVPSIVPLVSEVAYPDDSLLEEEIVHLDVDEKRKAAQYRDYRASYNKVPLCPVCEKKTGLRRFTSEGTTAQRLGIVCFNIACDFNKAHEIKTPLPFILTDDTIYARAPSIVLGTIDKLAMLGQRTSTIRWLLGMFGLARGVGPTGHLASPRSEGDVRAGLSNSGYIPAFPMFKDGQKVFFDPFPSLIIQDEAHLLEESLGTFSGLFDGLLEQSFRRIFEIAGDELNISRVWAGNQWAGPRMPKIIAATATISNPERQLEVLYQREPLRFPYPGSDLYHSFFAEPAPAPADNPARAALEESLPPSESSERTAPWMRQFTSIMTNDATHTVTAVTVLAAFHTVITHLWTAISDPAYRDNIVHELIQAQGSDEGSIWRTAALERAKAQEQYAQILALIDLHRIALTYVTNKKGGDQVMDALEASVHQRHRMSHKPLSNFSSQLISGGVDMQGIQDIMEQAQAASPGAAYPALDDQLRNIVATSAISHGVDVDRFNSMFFAGLPSDIAEYIQASSRVGRTHVGFVVLIPTPQSRRDRYVVETHDIFHRFLERMISPPAVERWAENAVRRVLASYVQAWAILYESELLLKAAEENKSRVESYETVAPLRSMARNDNIQFMNDLGNFILRCLGIEGRGPSAVGKPVYQELYRALIDQEVSKFSDSIRKMGTTLQLFEYWDDSAAAFKAPMTSLRDVDEAGFIVAGAYDEQVSAGHREINRDDLTRVMKAIRQQRGSISETDAETDADMRGR